MMMAINLPCWDYTPISLKKMIENHVNVVPNAWLTRKMMVPRASHVNLRIAFVVHSISMPESFISMRCGRSIGDQNCYSLDYRVESSTFFKGKIHQVKVKYGSNQLAKLGQKVDRVTSPFCLLPTHD